MTVTVLHEESCFLYLNDDLIKGEISFKEYWIESKPSREFFLKKYDIVKTALIVQMQKEISRSENM